MRWRVSALRLTWTLTMSLVASSSSNGTRVTARSRSIASSARDREWYCTRIPNPRARRATSPSDPPEADDIPSVAPCTSLPSSSSGSHVCQRSSDEVARLGDPPGDRHDQRKREARSAVVSVRTPGVLLTATPRRAQAETSMLS